MAPKYYKFKPLQPLFSECENNCFVAHAFLSNRLFQKKKKKQGGFRTYFFENLLGVFIFFTLPLEIPGKAKFHPWKLHKIVFSTLEIPRPLKDPHYFFLVILGNWSPLGHLLVTPENSTSSSPPPPVCFFFWNISINTTKVAQSHPINMGQL